MSHPLEKHWPGLVAEGLIQFPDPRSREPPKKKVSRAAVEAMQNGWVSAARGRSDMLNIYLAAVKHSELLTDVSLACGHSDNWLHSWFREHGEALGLEPVHQKRRWKK